MSSEIISRAGKRGELYPPKALREEAGIFPGSKIVFRVTGGRLEVEAIPSLEEVLKMGPVSEITLDELEKVRSDLHEALVKR